MAWLEDNQDELEGKASLDRVLGNSYEIELLKSAIPHSIYNQTFKHPDMQAFLLYGDSGCGKKTLAYALGKDLQYEGYEFINIDAVQLIGDKIKNTRENIKDFFMEIIEYFSEDEDEEEQEDAIYAEEDSAYEEETLEEKKLCILMKGIHLLCKDDVSVEMIKTYLEYLEEMEGIACVFMATTSKIESIPVTLRKSMVLCHIDLPSTEVRSEYLKQLLIQKNVYVDYLLTPQKMAESTEGYDYKKLTLLVKNMEMMLKREFIKWSKQKTDDIKNNLAEGLKNKSCQVTQGMFDEIIEHMKEPLVVSAEIVSMPVGQCTQNLNSLQQSEKDTKKQSFQDMIKAMADDLPEKPDF